MPAITFSGPRFDDNLQRAAWKLAKLWGASDARFDDSFQRLLWKGAVALGCPVRFDDEAQLILRKIAAKLGVANAGPADSVQSLFRKIADHYAVRTGCCGELASETQAIIVKVSEAIAGPTPPPSSQFSYEPQTAVMQWVDSGGVHNGDLAAFYSTPTWDSTVTVNWAGGTALTTISNLDLLPQLSSLFVPAVSSPLLSTIDCAGCSNLTLLVCDLGTVTNLILTGCASLLTLNCAINSIVSLDLSDSPLISVVDCSFNALTFLDITGCLLITYLDYSGNAGLIPTGP